MFFWFAKGGKEGKLLGFWIIFLLCKGAFQHLGYPGVLLVQAVAFACEAPLQGLVLWPQVV